MLCWLSRGKRQHVKKANQCGSVAQLTPCNELLDFGKRDPFDTIGLGGVCGCALIGSAIGSEEVVAGITDAVAGLVGDKRCQRTRPPASFLFDFTGRCVRWCFALLDDAHGDLPPPGIRDEAMAPQQQHAFRVFNDHCRSDWLEADSVVFEPVAVRQFDIDQMDVDPVAAVDRSFPVDCPLHMDLGLSLRGSGRISRLPEV